MSRASTTTETSSELLLPGYWVDGGSEAWCTLPWPTNRDERQRLAERSLAPGIIDWAEWRTEEPGLIHPLSGRHWQFTAGQKRFLILWYLVDDAGRFVYRSGVKRGAKGPIAHDTPVMTPDGWTTHGQLAPGSLVYAVDGSVTVVMSVEAEVLEPCYRLTFADGGSVVCTGGHRWPVDVFNGSRRTPEVLTVSEMLDRGVVFERPLTRGRTKATRPNVSRFRALSSPVVDGKEVPLQIPPYLLGWWLGDGDSDNPRITKGTSDMKYLTATMDRLGVEHGQPSWTHGETWRVRFGHGWAMDELRRMGVLGDKHIPGALLRASAAQRWALLQGLVDSDGTVGTSGQVEISLSNERLAKDVAELATTLGLMPRVTIGTTRIGATQYGPRWRIKFTPQRGETVALMPRKAARCGGSSQAKPFSRSRTIVAIEEVESVPARCLTVAHPSHQYLVGAMNVPTCNTGKDPFAAAMGNGELLGPVELDGFDAHGRPVGVRRGMPLVQVASNSEEQSKDLLRVANAMWGQEARDWYGLDVGQTRTVVKVSGGRFEVTTASEASSEGDPVTFGIINESHHMTDSSGGSKIAAVARRNVAKSPRQIQARVCEFTNAHMQGMDSVAERSFEAWQKQQAPSFPGAIDILYDSVEAPPDMDIMTEAGRMRGLRAAYMDAPWADLERLSAEMLDPRTSVADTIRFYLNGLASEEDAWVESAKFDALAADVDLPDRTPVALFLDCSKSEDATALVGCTLGLHVFEVGVWERPKGRRGEAWLAPRDDVDSMVRWALAKYDVRWLGIDPGPAKDGDDEALYWAHMIDDLDRDFRSRLPLWASPGRDGSPVLFDMRTSVRGSQHRNYEFTKTAELVEQWVDQEGASGPFRWDGSATLRRHVHNAKARPNPWGTSLGKVTRDSLQVVDAATAMVGAVMGARVAATSGKTGQKAKQMTPGQGRWSYTE
ncbi:MAG: hypothetical protein FWD63_05685 [Propionibacteriaceae bacterium]|nr:hypothetical protein [Propionibacteriaceae bacterium]